MRARRSDDRVDRMGGLSRLWRLGQDRMPEPGRAVNRARIVRLGRERERGAWRHRNVRAAGEREHGAGVAGRVGETYVADDGRDAEKARPSLGAGVEEGEGVVDAGVDVDEQGFGLLRHGGHGGASCAWAGLIPACFRRLFLLAGPAAVKAARAGQTDACGRRRTPAQWRLNGTPKPTHFSPRPELVEGRSMPLTSPPMDHPSSSDEALVCAR